MSRPWLLLLIVLMIGLFGRLDADDASIDKRGEIRPLNSELKIRLFGSPTRPEQVKPEMHGKSELIEETESGEDIGSAGESSALLNAEIQMRRVSDRLREFDAGRQTQTLQAGVLEQLNGVLKNRVVQGDDASVGTSSARSGVGAATLDVNVTETPEQTPVLLPMESLDDRWDKLPPRIRDQLRSSLFNQFAPQYRQLLERFYLRLATPQTNDNEE
ncbi:MAG: hypothetical protein ACJZ8O_12900 [Pirellulaceae bacterium]